MARPVQLLSTLEAASVLGITPSLVAVYCRSGRLRAAKVGRAWLFRPADLAAFARRERKPGPRARRKPRRK